jgi:aspartate kinase
MKVLKFGGASVKDAEGIRNLAKIVAAEKDNLLIVVSAFGKTTNALESLLKPG